MKSNNSNRIIGSNSPQPEVVFGEKNILAALQQFWHLSDIISDIIFIVFLQDEHGYFNFRDKELNNGFVSSK